MISRCPLFVLLACFCAQPLHAIKSEKDIFYAQGQCDSANVSKQSLDVFYQENASAKPVFVFIHGGSWSGGDKSTYGYIARKMVRRGYVAVMVNYRLHPKVTYEAMVDDCVCALSWITEHIGDYGGDAGHMVVAGHSAGGHLAAFIALNDVFVAHAMENPVDKVVLLDAFGLDMLSYFRTYNNGYSRELLPIFGHTESAWREASPLYQVDGREVPFLVMTGGRSYEAIRQSSALFAKRLKEYGTVCVFKEIKGRRHFAMVVNMVFPRNRIMRTMMLFLENSMPH